MMFLLVALKSASGLDRLKGWTFSVIAASWLDALKNGKRAIATASAHPQCAADLSARFAAASGGNGGRRFNHDDFSLRLGL
jgi:DNA-directed RNA polymerase specialized sigma24 family protein